jgi:hypothetical protein
MPNQLISAGRYFKMSQLFPELYLGLVKQDRQGNILVSLHIKKTTYLTVYHACGLSILFFLPGTEFQPRL